VARQRPPDQIDKILDATERIMRRNGRSGAAMSLIAEEAGVALGTLYHYFENKDALASWAIMRALYPDTEIPSEVPIQVPEGWGLEAVAPLLDLPVQFPILFSSNQSADHLQEAVEELYDTVNRGRRVIDLVESASADNSDLADRWFGVMVRDLTEAWMALLERHAPGTRTVDERRVAAVFILDNCTFFSRTRHNQPYSQGLGDDAMIRSAVLELISNAIR
jgi:AcrR family transcriptional regulator